MEMEAVVRATAAAARAAAAMAAVAMATAAVAMVTAAVEMEAVVRAGRVAATRAHRHRTRSTSHSI